MTMHASMDATVPVAAASSAHFMHFASMTETNTMKDGGETTI